MCMAERKKKREKIKRYKGRVCIIIAVILIIAFLAVTLLFSLFCDLKMIGLEPSSKSGFYVDEIELGMNITGFSMRSPLTIKYNMNGDNLNDTSEYYDGKIRLEVPEEGYRLYTIKATVCDGDNNCIEPITFTYILGKKLDEDITLKTININCSQYDLYDYNSGIMVGGATYDLYRETAVDGEYIIGNYNNRGKKWMRDAFVTMFDTDGSLIMNRKASIGISGWTSSAYSVKSMKVVTFVDSDEGVKEEVFRLRSGSQDQFSGNIRSSINSRLTENSGFDGGNTTERMVVFLNGDYYGIFDKQIDYSKSDLVSLFGLDKEKNVSKYRGSEESVFRAFGIGAEIWNDLDSAGKRERLEELTDMEDFLRYYAIQILTNNTDWPMNNYVAWRYEGRKDDSNKYKDGKLRFILRDTDLSYYTDENINWFEGSKGDIFRFLMEGINNGAGSVFSKVMESDYYRNRFIEILRELINGPFRTENVLKIIDEEAAKIDHQVELWSTPEEYEEWKQWIEVLREAAGKREQEIRDDVLEYFNVIL